MFIPSLDPVSKHTSVPTYLEYRLQDSIFFSSTSPADIQQKCIACATLLGHRTSLFHSTGEKIDGTCIYHSFPTTRDAHKLRRLNAPMIMPSTPFWHLHSNRDVTLRRVGNVIDLMSGSLCEYPLAFHLTLQAAKVCNRAQAIRWLKQVSCFLHLIFQIYPLHQSISQRKLP